MELRVFPGSGIFFRAELRGSILWLQSYLTGNLGGYDRYTMKPGESHQNRHLVETQI